MTPVKDSGIPWLGSIPAHWKLNYLGNAVDVVGGATPSKERIDFWNGSIPWVSPKDMKSDVITDSEDHVTESALKGSSIRLIPDPAVLMVTRGMILDHTVPIAITARPVTLNQDMKALRPRSGLRADYLAQYLRAVNGALLARVEEAGHGTKALRTDLWRKLPLLIPPTDEQRAIVGFVDRKTAAIDAFIAKKERLFELLQEKRQALVTEAVTMGLAPNVRMKESGVHWFHVVPAHWEMRRLKRISPKLQGRLVVQPHLYFSDEGVPIVFGYNIKNGVIDESGLSRISFEADSKHRHAKVRAGDVLTVRLGDPGMSAVVPPSLDGCHFASIMWIHQHARFDSRWLCHCMNSRPVQAQIEAVNYGAAQTQFNIDDAVDFVLPFPPLDEQQQIAEHISSKLQELRHLENKLKHQLNALREYRQALITAAVTGKLDVTRPSEAA